MRQRVQGLKKKTFCSLQWNCESIARADDGYLTGKCDVWFFPRFDGMYFCFTFTTLVLFPCLSTFFFCLLIFSFSLAFLPSLREPSLFNAWPPNSSTPRCTTPSFLCFVHPLHSSVVHHSTIPLNLLFLFSWTGEILKRVFLAQEKCGQNFTKTTWCYRARVLNLNIDDD